MGRRGYGRHEGQRRRVTWCGTPWRRARCCPPRGSAVTGAIDWTRRYALMRTHTALHILCGVVWRDYGAQVTGGNMDPLAGRMDFEFATLHGDLVAEIEARCNGEVAAARAIRVQDPAARRGVPDSRPDPHQDQPAARRHPRGAHGGDRRAGPAGRRRHARRQHARGGPDPGDGLQVQGGDQ